MAWFDESVFYHIYPLGLVGAPKKNKYTKPVSRIKEIIPWVDHLVAMGCNALYIGPLFQSVGHGYETTDYKTLDSRLGTNEDLIDFVKYCHKKKVHVIFDGVFNHVGRDFFAFQDVKKNREQSAYKDWFCNVNFNNDNSYHDGFNYDNWGGYDLLVKLNQRNPAVIDYICSVIQYWVDTFDVDGIRLDAADVLDFDFMKALRQQAATIKPDFYLMGEVIHGEYNRWSNPEHLHAVTNYALHKALYSGHNEHNYFEIAHTVKRLNDMGHIRLYNFVDNHDVARIASKLTNPAHLIPVHILLYTLPGVPSIYYGSEWAIEGKKERWSDWNLRPQIDLESMQEIPLTQVISTLGHVRQTTPAISYGEYQELLLTNRQYAYRRGNVVVMVNNDENVAHIDVSVDNGTYTGVLSGQVMEIKDGHMAVDLPACGGEIWLPDREETFEPIDYQVDMPKPEEKTIDLPKEVRQVPYEEMSVEELQACILQKMANNGSVTEQMKQSVLENVYHDSLLNWVKSFR